MEKINSYHTIVINQLEQYANDWNIANDKLTSRLIVDNERKSYLLIRFGWRDEEEYLHNCLFHIDIIDDKVWIQENRTDILIAEILIEAGIDKEDIVLGILPPSLRIEPEYTVD